jgi:hypothetical protein
MENRVDFIHREVFLNLNDEEVDHFFVRLKQINRIVTFTNEDLAVFARQELHELLVDDGRVPKFEGAVHE